ncbi:MAG: PASTA domain-containing protein [Cyclobacteriaceae bacterium]|nr:PASTA domain-containing protein [Cyclobacteriaceae bacterium]
MELLKYIFSKTFIINFIIALAIGIGGLFGVSAYLDYYSYHGQTIEVPDFSEMYEDEAERLIARNELRYMIIDSVYTMDDNRGKILDQEPKAGELVKKNRVIYLTIHAKNPQKINMPNLIDLSLRQAISIIEVYGLKVGDLEYVPDIAYNAVLDQKNDKGESIEPGSKIAKGSKVNLVLGLGESDEEIRIPALLGMRLEDAKIELNTMMLNIGSVVWDKNIEDSAEVIIYRQIPPFSKNKYINIGKSIDVFVTEDSSKVKDALELLENSILEDGDEEEEDDEGLDKEENYQSE